MWTSGHKHWPDCTETDHNNAGPNILFLHTARGAGTRIPGGRTVNILSFFNNFSACFRLKPAHGRLHICFLWKTFPNNSSET